jgi:hypothetical protein
MVYLQKFLKEIDSLIPPNCGEIIIASYLIFKSLFSGDGFGTWNGIFRHLVSITTTLHQYKK